MGTSVRWRFWEGFLKLADGKTPLNARMLPSDRNNLDARAGVGGLSFCYGITKSRIRVELYINRRKGAVNKEILDDLQANKDEIERAFGGTLSWQPLEKRKACRIAYDSENGGYGVDEAKWPRIQGEMIEAMVRLEKALTPFIRVWSRN
jgi:hypothetical protein